MKSYFIVNPKAGKGKALEIILPEIEKYKQSNYGFEYEIYVTKSEGDATAYVKSVCEKGEEARFYACGGDGTLYEVANGAFGFKNAAVGSIPLGSGNDYIRLYGTTENFLDIKGQIEGTDFVVDVIKCGDKIAMNQCSMGFDAEICNMQKQFKKVKFMSGETSYFASLLYCFIKKIKHEFTVSIDGGKPFTEKVLFCVIANSRWYGGGFMPAPFAMPNDGQIDVVIEKKTVNRLKLLGLINLYKAGKIIGDDMTIFKRAKKVHVKTKEPATVNIDGECETVTEAEFELIPGGMRFIVPNTTSFFEDVKSGKISNEIKI